MSADVERPRGRAPVFAPEAREQVLGADVAVVEAPGLFLGEDNRSSRLVTEPLEHDATPVSQALA